jgi:hypothetical protein
MSGQSIGLTDSDLMAYPAKPFIQTSYTAVEQALGDGSLPGQELDVDFANMKTSVDALNDFVRGITRSDGRLANGTVTADSLAADVLLGIAPPEIWESGVSYAPPATVFNGSVFYIANVPHTSTVFADDLAAGRWALLANFAIVQEETFEARDETFAARDETFDARDATLLARDDVLQRYLGSFSTPPATDAAGGPLTAGMLYFNDTQGVLFVYDGARWLSASSSIETVRQVFTFIATAGQTVFSGLDANGETLALDISSLTSVFLNGVRLVETTDYTINSGTNTVTLTTGAALNDTVQVEAFGNINTKITVSDHPPSGGSAGDLWFQYSN